MNCISKFRLCKLTDKELTEKVDKCVDKMYQTGKIPTRNIPAKPDDDFDLLIGELLLRFADTKKENKLKMIKDLFTVYEQEDKSLMMNQQHLEDHFEKIKKIVMENK